MLLKRLYGKSLKVSNAIYRHLFKKCHFLANKSQFTLKKSDKPSSPSPETSATAVEVEKPQLEW